MRRAVLGCCLVLVASVPAFAAESPPNPWIGTWKLDPARSHFKRHTFTYSRLPNGMLHLEDGTLGSYDFAVDGKPYKSGWDVTRVWTTAGPNAWNVVVINAYGKELGKARHVLSADGRTLTSTFAATRAKVRGKLDGTAIQTLAPDGKSFTDVGPDAGSDGKLAEKETAFYVRQ